MVRNEFMKMEDFRARCIANGYFTCGSVKQYEYAIRLAGSIDMILEKAFTELVTATYICSDMDMFTRDEIRDELMKIYH